MAKNKGTLEGDIQEISFVKNFNKNKTSPQYALLTEDKNINHLYMVRVTSNQYSTLSSTTTKTRADCYLIYCSDERIFNVLYDNDFYLSESNINSLNYNPIERSGISVKLQDSKKYQLLKVGANSFFNLFQNYELGAGASLFCQRKDELVKNVALLKGWNTSYEKMTSYFSFIENISSFLQNQAVCKQIKTYCINQISHMINSSKDLQLKIFNGYPLYKEPYSAWYIYSNNSLEKLDYVPFTITTGSGRSHGDYTIVLKPKF